MIMIAAMENRRIGKKATAIITALTQTTIEESSIKILTFHG
jgi:hypothetical protein